MKDNLSEIDRSTILGISLSSKHKRKSSSNAILAYTIDQLASVYPDTHYLSVSDFCLPYFEGLMPDEIRDPSYTAVYKAVKTSRAIILSVPCYWSGISGIAKNFIDVLCGPLYDYPDTHKSVFYGKVMAIIIVAADKESAKEGENQMSKIVHAIGGDLLPVMVIANNPRTMSGNDGKKLQEQLLQLNCMLMHKLKMNGAY